MPLIIPTSVQINDREKTERVKIIHRQFRNMTPEIRRMIEDSHNTNYQLDYFLPLPEWKFQSK